MLSVISLSILQSSSIFSSASRDDFAIPGCEEAWLSVNKAKVFDDLKTVIVNNCSELYQQGWRLNDKRFKREVVGAEQCKQSWTQLQDARQLDSVKFMVMHNCPVFYRYGWITPPR